MELNNVRNSFNSLLNLSQEFAQECGEDPEILTLTPTMKKLILDLHNRHRNKLSGGKLPGYAPAARMPQLRWNDDLAYVAG